MHTITFVLRFAFSTKLPDNFIRFIKMALTAAQKVAKPLFLPDSTEVYFPVAGVSK